ncbi:endonuclease III, partial [Phenoliferia sp. Uapishka_3]
MRLLLLPFLTLFTLAVAAKSNLPAAKTRLVPNKYIVSLSSDSSLKRSYSSPGAALTASLQSRGVAGGVQVVKEFNSALFAGVVVRVSDGHDISAIYDLEGIEQVWPVRLYPAPKPRVVKSGLTAKEVGDVDTFSTHVMTGVDKLHEEGWYGKGMVVGIIDTGVDYYHPALGGCFGTGCKVAKGYDYAGNTYNGVDNFDITPDPDPWVHFYYLLPVAKLIISLLISAANSTSPAPVFTALFDAKYTTDCQATLGMYKVFGCENAAGDSYTDDSLIIEGLLGAYNDGSDVITLSLGGSSGWSESPSAVVASNIVSEGRVVTIAMGNSGEAGTFYASSPGGGLNVWSIASVDNSGLIAYKATVTGGPSNFTSFDYFSDNPEGFENLPIYALSSDASSANTGDACDTLPSSTPDLSGYIVVAKRGTCTFVEKYENVAAAGGRYLFIYNNEGGEFTYLDSTGYNITVAFLYEDVGNQLVALSGSAARVSANNNTIENLEYSTAGKVSDYSSYGPNFEMDQPSALLAAPGGNIFSTLPGDTFGVYSGTSMATPFVAGSAALYWSIKGKKTSALALRDIFATTSTPVANQTGIILESVVHQVHTIKVTNNGAKTVTLPISHEPAGTALTFEAGTNIHNTWPVPLVSNQASVKFSKKSLKLKAGESATIIATFSPPSGLHESEAPIYSGFVKIGTQLSVPYYGLASKLSDLPILDDTDAFFGVNLPALADASGDFVSKGDNVTISKTSGDSIGLIFRLVTGTHVLRVDVVSASTSFKPSLNKRGLVDGPQRTDLDLAKRATATASTANLMYPVPWARLNATGMELEVKSSSYASSFDYVPTLGVVDYETYLYRNSDQDSTDYYYDTFNGTVYSTTSESSTTVLPVGEYKILVRALKLQGNPKIESHYESETPPPEDSIPATPTNKRVKALASPSPSKSNAASSPVKASPTLAKKLAGLATYRQTPYPDFGKPTAEQCKTVHDLLAGAHGTPVRPTTLVDKPNAAAGCGQVPSVLDALVRTILSQNTTSANSTRAKNAIDEKYGRGNYRAVLDGTVAELQQTIIAGGLANVKGKAIHKILTSLDEKEGGKGSLSLDYLHDYSDLEALTELVSFDGVGPKTASCVLLFCLARESFAVDTHIFRITRTLGWIPAHATRETAFQHLDVLIPDDLKYGLHSLLVRHGRGCEKCAANGVTSMDHVDHCPINSLVTRSLAGSPKKPKPKSRKGTKGKGKATKDDSDEDGSEAEELEAEWEEKPPAKKIKASPRVKASPKAVKKEALPSPSPRRSTRSTIIKEELDDAKIVEELKTAVKGSVGSDEKGMGGMMHGLEV